ncbi:hypothetical protein ABT008_26220 [Micromonospora sp. NPDC002389]|uniref:hypothetical protein n=1 Tax=Micromonospora sp. NPDC002389 TaxID=3154272 RepID=UPI003316A8E7
MSGPGYAPTSSPSTSGPGYAPTSSSGYAPASSPPASGSGYAPASSPPAGYGPPGYPGTSTAPTAGTAGYGPAGAPVQHQPHQYPHQQHPQAAGGQQQYDSAGQAVYPAGQSGAYPPQAWGQPGAGQPPSAGGMAFPVAQSGSGRNRAAIVVAIVAVVVAVVAVIGLGVLIVNDRRAASPTAPAESAAADPGPPPTGLELRDDAATIRLTWTDPSDGLVPFMVAGGRAGQALGVLATVGQGQTSYTVNGLNSRVDYCFTVLAVYGTNEFATSSQVCTTRESGAGQN